MDDGAVFAVVAVGVGAAQGGLQFVVSFGDADPDGGFGVDSWGLCVGLKLPFRVFKVPGHWRWFSTQDCNLDIVTSLYNWGLSKDRAVAHITEEFVVGSVHTVWIAIKKGRRLT